MSVLIDESEALEALEPESIKHDASVRGVTKAYAPHIADAALHMHDGIKLYRLGELSSSELDHLAAQWHANSWSDAWPVETKRRMLRSVITELSRIGTVSSIKNIIAGFGSAAVLQEWWQTEPQGTPHTFQITIDVGQVEGLSEAEAVDELTRLINNTKPVRSQYTLTLMVKGHAQFTMACVGRMLSYARIGLLSHAAQATWSATIHNAARSATYARIGIASHIGAASGKATIVNAARPVAYGRIKANLS